MTELQLSCTACKWSIICRKEAMLGWLRSINMLKREAKPEPELVVELFKVSADKFSCPKCQRHGLRVQEPSDNDDEAWGMARKCEACKSPIPTERLEALPNTRICVRCQELADHGQDSAEVQYCPRCGSAMTLKLSRGAGISRYVMACTSCGGR